MDKDALKGLRVADFSWVWAGPLATLLLSFMGAEIIKIESRKRVDQADVAVAFFFPARLAVRFAQTIPIAGIVERRVRREQP